MQWVFIAQLIIYIKKNTSGSIQTLNRGHNKVWRDCRAVDGTRRALCQSGMFSVARRDLSERNKKELNEDFFCCLSLGLVGKVLRLRHESPKDPTLRNVKGENFYYSSTFATESRWQRFKIVKSLSSLRGFAQKSVRCK